MRARAASSSVLLVFSDLRRRRVTFPLPYRAQQIITENKTIQRRMTRMIDPKERDIDLAMQKSEFYKNAKVKAQTPANLR